ncbi:MAG: copper-binding protein [Pseudobdellovibrionaceae bacterium]
MKKIMLTTALALILATPAMAKDYTIKEVSNPDAKQPYYFDPSNLTIQPGDTVTFLNVQDEMHDVMFVEVPKGVDEMIMSPMHEKEGDKFSYTFTIPGTYKFHCHPHEKLGMKGTLIVGSPSKKGETVLMDHHKMAKIHDDAMKGEVKQSGSVAKGPQGTGVIKSVDTASHKIIVVHDPIAELGWPKMTMEFVVDPSIDLSAVHEGDKIRFTLKAKGDEDYSIINLQKY